MWLRVEELQREIKVADGKPAVLWGQLRRHTNDGYRPDSTLLRYVYWELPVCRNGCHPRGFPHTSAQLRVNCVCCYAQNRIHNEPECFSLARE